MEGSDEELASGAGFVVEMESMYTVPVNVPLATREEGEEETEAAVELGIIVEGMMRVTRKA